MSKTIKIPECMSPSFVVVVNGVKYAYPAGETVEVPDHVAKVIEAHVRLQHTAKQPESDPGASGGGVDEKTIIEKLAPAFTKTGAVVTCNPVEGHPLEVVSRITSGVKDFTPVPQLWTDEYTGDQALLIAGLPAGEYTLNTSSENGADIRVVAYDAESGTMKEICAVDYSENGIEATATFTHNGGDLLITDDGWVGVDNIKLTAEISEFTSVSLIHNGKTRKVELPEAVSHGKFTWSSGVLSVPKGNPNLITVDLTNPSNWRDVHLGEFTENAYSQTLPNGTYTICVEMLGQDSGIDIYYNDFGAWAHITSIQSGGAETFDVCLDEEYPTTDICIVKNGEIAEIKLEEGGEFTGFLIKRQLTPHEILGLPGVNTLKSITGDTEVSGTVTPAAVFAEQEARIAALEAALTKE